VRSVDASLTRLGVDAIDTYFVHGWDQHTPVLETLDTLAGLVRSGKIHSIGWSNVTGWQLAQIMTEARLNGLVAPCVVQPQYNLLDRSIELEVLPCRLDNDISITPWSPLGGGWLTGKTPETNAQPAHRVSVTTPTVASRHATHATTTAAGTSSTPSTTSPNGTSDQWARSRLLGC
jgi:aryl-alcohol dehydrogenase-like predicted oxidoreductase